MKRYFYPLMIMAAAVIASCTKQTLGEEQPKFDSESATYTYTVSANTVETKSDYDANGKFMPKVKDDSVTNARSKSCK